MKLRSRSQIEALAGFKSPNFLTTTFYLDTDKSRLNKKEIAVSLKNLLTEARSKLATMDLGKDKKDSLCQDLDAINEYCTQHLGLHNDPGLALFSCGRQELFEAIFLPHGPRNRVIVDANFYLRPLSAIFDKYHRICAFLINRRNAAWYEIFMEEMTPLDGLEGDVPGRVKEGGFEGTESKRIERHIEAHLQDFYKKAVQKTSDLFKKQKYDWLFVGCDENSTSILDPLLPGPLKERFKGRLKAKPVDPPSKVLKEAIELENALKAQEEADLVQRLTAELERDGLACSGVKETLHRLNLFEVQTLVVTHSFSKEGRACPSCKFLYLDDQQCPICQRKTEIILDVIDEAIETAIKRGCQVKHLTPPSKLDRFGKIGAFLKYKI